MTELRKRSNGSAVYVARILPDPANGHENLSLWSLFRKIISTKSSPKRPQQCKTLRRALRLQKLPPKKLFIEASEKENSGIVANLGNGSVHGSRIVLKAAVKEGFRTTTKEGMMKFEVAKKLLRKKGRNAFLTTPSPKVVRRALLRTKTLSVITFKNRQGWMIVIILQLTNTYKRKLRLRLCTRHA